MEENISVNQNIIIENRKCLNISGVKEVTSFDDETILLDSVQGKITIKGDGLHVESFNTITGDFCANGKVHAVVYMSYAKTGGFISRLFK